MKIIDHGLLGLTLIDANERVLAKHLTEADAAQFQFMADCALFVVRCADGVLGHNIPAQGICTKHGVTWKGALERSELPDSSKNSISRGDSARAGMASFDEREEAGGPAEILDTSEYQRNAAANFEANKAAAAAASQGGEPAPAKD